jgi:hypothetical protein
MSLRRIPWPTNTKTGGLVRLLLWPTVIKTAECRSQSCLTAEAGEMGRLWHYHRTTQPPDRMGQQALDTLDDPQLSPCVIISSVDFRLCTRQGGIYGQGGEAKLLAVLWCCWRGTEHNKPRNNASIECGAMRVQWHVHERVFAMWSCWVQLHTCIRTSGEQAT